MAKSQWWYNVQFPSQIKQIWNTNTGGRDLRRGATITLLSCRKWKKTTSAWLLQRRLPLSSRCCRFLLLSPPPPAASPATSLSPAALSGRRGSSPGWTSGDASLAPRNAARLGPLAAAWDGRRPWLGSCSAPFTASSLSPSSPSPPLSRRRIIG